MSNIGEDRERGGKGKRRKGRKDLEERIEERKEGAWFDRVTSCVEFNPVMLRKAKKTVTYRLTNG